MCGIMGYFALKENSISNEKFFDISKYLFKDLQREGGSFNNIDASGYYHPYIGVVKGNYKAEDFIEMEEFDLIKKFPVPMLFLGHVRKTTEGHPEENENNHPLWSNNYILIHNGSVESDILDKDITEKYQMPGGVDSNHILACIEKYGIEEFRKHLKGMASIIFAPRNSDNELYIYRDTRPMFLLSTNHTLWFSSTDKSLKEVKERITNKKEENTPFSGINSIVELKNGILWKITNKQGHFSYEKYEKEVLPSITKTYNTSVHVPTPPYYSNSYSSKNVIESPDMTKLNIVLSLNMELCTFCGNFLTIMPQYVSGGYSCDICNKKTTVFKTTIGTKKTYCYTKSKYNKESFAAIFNDETIINNKIVLTFFNGFHVIINDKNMYVYNQNIYKNESGNWRVTKDNSHVYTTKEVKHINTTTNWWVDEARDCFKIYQTIPYVHVNLEIHPVDTLFELMKTIITEFETSFSIIS